VPPYERPAIVPPGALRRLQRFLHRLPVLLLLIIGISGAVHAQPTAESRVALVIGNSEYRHGGSLRNPVNDAADIAQRLRALGFDVTLRTNLSQREFNRALTEFGEKVSPGGTALFFYAGHGIQSRGSNFLIPVDAQIRQEQSIRSESVNVDQVLDQLTGAQVGLVILDACRNSPFERAIRSTTGTGLAQIDAPKGTLISYATAPGRVAEDGVGQRNSPYTAALLKALEQPERPVEDVLKEVRRTVTQVTANRQLPWESSSLTGDFYFRRITPASPPASVAVPAPPSGPGVELTVELAFWDAIKNSTAGADYAEYLRQYPQGRFAGLARSRLARLSEPAQTATAAVPAALPAAASPAPRAMLEALNGRRYFGRSTKSGGEFEVTATIDGATLALTGFRLHRGPVSIIFSCGPFGRGATLDARLSITPVDCHHNGHTFSAFLDLASPATLSGRFPQLVLQFAARPGLGASEERIRLIALEDLPRFEQARRMNAQLGTEEFALSAEPRR
jgi:hypothetical protein